jgi:hypothetical protein
MPASVRLMVLMSPEERAALDAKARAPSVTAGQRLPTADLEPAPVDHQVIVSLPSRTS